MSLQQALTTRCLVIAACVCLFMPLCVFNLGRGGGGGGVRGVGGLEPELI
jgi:hypothetical protein